MVPVRTCVGCRRRGAASTMIRLARIADEIVLDRERAVPGRGAWIHPQHKCVDAAVRQKSLNRAFRTSGGLRTSQLEVLTTEENRLNG